MHDFLRFTILVAAAAVVFISVLLFVLRRRVHIPKPRVLASTTFVVVVIGMLFARYGHILFRPPWWIYYGIPALTTFILPIVTLRMNWREVAQYVPLAIMMAPAIHVFFSLFIGWHDYMPFPFYVPSLLELLRRLG